MLIAVNQLFEYHLWLNSKRRHTFDEFAVFISAVCSQSLGLLPQWQSGRCMKLTTVGLLPRIGMLGAEPLFPMYLYVLVLNEAQGRLLFIREVCYGVYSRRHCIFLALCVIM